eukprot:113582_1
MDVNSPRNKTKQSWGNDEAASNAAVAGLVTQVPRNNANNQPSGGGVESLVTQVPRDDDETERNIIDVQPKGGICACFSCLWSCCSGPQRPADVAMSNQQPIGNSNKTVDAVDSKPKTSETANSSLLDGTGNGREAKNEQEDSYSSTEYPQSLLPPQKPEHVG